LWVSHELFHVVDGASAAPASSNAFTTSSKSRAAIHFVTAPSSISLRRLRSPAEENHGFSAMSGRPTSRITRWATDVALADTATQRPSRVR